MKPGRLYKTNNAMVVFGGENKNIIRYLMTKDNLLLCLYNKKTPSTYIISYFLTEVGICYQTDTFLFGYIEEVQK
jgi:hypothetical protein